MTAKGLFRFFAFFWVIAFICGIALLGVIGYVAYHFIAMLW